MANNATNQRLCDACSLGHFDKVINLLSPKKFLFFKFAPKAEINSVSCDGLTPLHHAAKVGHNEIAEWLIDNGANIDATDSDGDTPLHFAIWDFQRKTAALLINRGADMEMPGNKGYHPLHIASWWNQVDIARLLLENGADPDATDLMGLTPLHIAAMQGHKEIAGLLIDSGADTGIISTDGLSVKEAATVKNHQHIVELLNAQSEETPEAEQDSADPGQAPPPEAASLSDEQDTGDRSWVESAFNLEMEEQPEDRVYWNFPELEDIPNLFDDRQFSQMEDILQSALQKYPDFYFVHSWLASISEAQGDYQQAATILRQGLTRSKKKNTLCGRLALLEYNHGSLEKAVKWWIKSALLQMKNRSIDDVQAFLYLAQIARFTCQKTAYEKLKDYSGRGFHGPIDLNAEGQEKLLDKLNAASSEEISEAIAILVEEYWEEF